MPPRDIDELGVAPCRPDRDRVAERKDNDAGDPQAQAQPDRGGQGGVGDREAPRSAAEQDITRDSNGQITQIVNQDLNLNSIVRSGIDVGLEYRFDAPAFLSSTGKMDFRLFYSRLIDFYTDFAGIDGVTRTDSKGEIGAWKNTGQMQLGYRDGPLRLRWKARYTGPAVDSNIRLANAESVGSNPPFLHVGSRVRHDFYLSFDLDPDQLGEMRFYTGVNNAFNSRSPFLPSGTVQGGSNNFSGYYDIIGRYVYAGFEVKF